jgi:SAM-dependent MidA family methyltransferase
VQRLTGEGRTGMGKLFKVAAFADPKIGPLPGF